MSNFDQTLARCSSRVGDIECRIAAGKTREEGMRMTISNLQRIALVAMFTAGAVNGVAQEILPVAESPASLQAAAVRQLAPHAVQIQPFEYVIPELIIGGDWTTTIRIANRGSTTVPLTNVYMVDNNGADLNSTFQLTSGAIVKAASFSFTLPPGTMVEATFLGDVTAFGHAIIDYCSSPTNCANSGVYGEVTLRDRNATRPDFESIFPFERPQGQQYILFDGRGLLTTLYLTSENVSSSQLAIDVLNANNVLLRTVNLSFSSLAAQILQLHVIAPETIGIQGTLVIRAVTPQALFTATGLRINPSNSFTPIRAFIPAP